MTSKNKKIQRNKNKNRGVVFLMRGKTRTEKEKN
jgi:hypothetical protein